MTKKQRELVLAISTVIVMVCFWLTVNVTSFVFATIAWSLVGVLAGIICFTTKMCKD